MRFSFPQSTQRRMRFTWRYWRRNAPWDSGIVPPEITAWVEASERQGRAPGRALDLGCGTGTTTRYLAAHGWQAVGVDFAPNAIRRARRKARGQSLPGSATFFSADVSRPGFLPNMALFDLLIDIGCLHGLTPTQRATYAANLAQITQPGAVFLLYAFLPRLSRDGSRQVGIDPDGLRALLPGWEQLEYTPGHDITGPFASAWYTLRRQDTTP